MGHKWSPSHVQSLIKETTKIIEICGKDPLRVTAVEMDKLNLRLYCAKEAKKMKARRLLTWRQAVSSRGLLDQVLSSEPLYLGCDRGPSG